MTAKNAKKIMPLFLFALLTFTGYGSPFYESSENGKEVYVQLRVRNHPDFSMERTAESENFVIFWDRTR